MPEMLCMWKWSNTEAATGRLDRSTTNSKKVKNMEVWKDFLAVSFDGLAESVAATSSNTASSSADATSLSQEPQHRMKEEIRSCHKSLTSILAPQVKQDETLKASVMAKIKDTMLAVAEYSHDMSALLQATIIKYVTHPLPDQY
ncbi:hypothetical protein DM01DRAFT_325966 [Hesseltinella vesiculosa]|uniref:Uncharacterized protein n=1 Tax=Hesseltinella vesiculosa TaxID=101127 RepID=A0A1X2GKZ1_9FUNG|nr:hypothetical protein DM01DRAFT_325966 [Hesseltinella vesiculosa]